MPTAVSDVNFVKADPPDCKALFTGFLLLSVMAFGGVLPLAQRMVVDRYRWLSAAEFTDLLGLCQFLPGGNIINLSVAIGMTFRGVRGAISAMLGLIVVPTLIVLVLGTIYDRFQQNPILNHLFAGLAAAAAGLLIAMTIKLSLPLRYFKPLIPIALLCFIAIAVFRLPLLPTMLVLTPISIYITWRAKL
jgi:chromate transporter